MKRLPAHTLVLLLALAIYAGSWYAGQNGLLDWRLLVVGYSAFIFTGMYGLILWGHAGDRVQK